MRNTQATHNILAVSASKAEPALNEVQELDTAMLVAMGDILKLSPTTETNKDEAIGKEEADTIYNLGGIVEGTLNFEKCQPQHLAFLAAYALGVVSTAAAGTGYAHTITPIAGDLSAGRSNPSFTAAQKLGDTIIKRLFGSCFVDSLTLSFEKDAWVKAVGGIKGTGLMQSNMVREQVAGDSDDTQVTLSANAVEGASAEARVDSVHQVRWKKTGDDYWQDVRFSAVSDATPAVITISAPDAGNSDAGAYEVLYVPDEDTALETGSASADPPDDASGVITDSAATLVADEQIGRWLVMTSGTASGRSWKISDNDATTITCAGYNLYAAGVRSGDSYQIVQFGWLPLPGRVSEPPLRTSQMMVVLGGAWDGSDFQGGRILANELKSVSWTLNNTITPELTAGSGLSRVANRALRAGREQTVSLGRDLVEAIMQQRLDDEEPEYFGLKVVGTGPEYEAGHAYQVEVIWPRVSLLSAEASLDERRLGEQVELAVLEDDTYGSVIVRVTNKVASYAA